MSERLPAAAVSPLGELRDRLDRAARRLLRDDVYRPEWIVNDITFECDPTPFYDWYTAHEFTWFGDVSGRYLNAMAVLAHCLGGLPAKGADVARRVLDAQSADGHFGPERPLDFCDRAQVSGTAWLLLALPRWYELTGDRRALEAARRLFAWYAAITPYWLRPDEVAQPTTRGEAALVYSTFTHCLGGLAALWRVEPRDEYPELALTIAAAVKSFDTEKHSHHFLASLRGLVEWYDITGEEWLLRKAIGERDRILAEGVLDTGGVPEIFDQAWTDEGCSEVDWVLLNLQLFTTTGNPDYVETAERAIYGHLFLNQEPGGGFGCWCGFHRPVGAMPAGAAGMYKEAFWCCSMHGASGLAELTRYIYTSRDTEIFVNLFLGCEAAIETSQGVVRVAQTGEGYPHPGVVALHVEVPAGANITLHLRLPRHTPLGSARLDGVLLPNDGAEAGLRSVALSGGSHRVELRFRPALRAEKVRRPDLFGGKHTLWYGPMPLGTNAIPERFTADVSPAALAAIEPAAASREGAFPSEIEFLLPAGDAPTFARTRDRRHVVLYPLAAHGYRRLSFFSYLF